MEAKAILRSTRISPQKARLVADQVRGLPVARALALKLIPITASASIFLADSRNARNAPDFASRPLTPAVNPLEPTN